MVYKFNENDLKLYKLIDEILYSDWNPIGVTDLPGDEYHNYLLEIFRLKKDGAGVATIAVTLSKYELNILGESGDNERCRRIAMKIESL